jgi:glycogen operon protein
VDGDADLHVMMNMFWEPLDFEVPQRVWYTAIDTFAPSPDDIVDRPSDAPFIGPRCTVQGRSIVVLVGTAAGRVG